jgi:hypothetical protein
MDLREFVPERLTGKFRIELGRLWSLKRKCSEKVNGFQMDSCWLLSFVLCPCPSIVHWLWLGWLADWWARANSGIIGFVPNSHRWSLRVEKIFWL